MVDLILSNPATGPASLFTRNFRVHSGIPIGLYSGGPRAPVALIYGNISENKLEEYSKQYSAIVAIPSMDNDEIPDVPFHYETMTVKAPILATMQEIEREGFTRFVKTFEGGTLVLKGYTESVLTLLFAADLVKSTIRILSGELENNTGKDSYGRPKPPPESVTYEPAVSFHFNLIENAIRYVYAQISEPLLSIPRWPDSAPFAVFLSHDVDVVRKWTKKRAAYELMLGLRDLLKFKGGKIAETISSIWDATKGRDPYWQFDELLFMENGSGFKTTWFFAPFGGIYNNRDNTFDPVYHRSPAEITSMIRRIIEQGGELALHGTRGSFLDGKVLKKQLESFESRLGFKLFGVRHHYLMFRHGKTLESSAEIGMQYDSTLGFSDRSGFRNGMASPFFPFPSDHPAGAMVEIPLNFMDTVFVHDNDNPESVMKKVTETYLYAKAARGMFSSLVHPENMDSSEIPGLKAFYRSLLTRFRTEGACSMTGAELLQWWRARESVLKKIEFGTNAWRIKDVFVPENMNVIITAPDIRSMRFSIEGLTCASKLDRETLTISPGGVDPEKGITITRTS
ncbi:hypothetical protein ES708_04173 [subsurface metagenome]